jgi:oxygen-independent coproporphyrinogen-3 oxidase
MAWGSLCWLSLSRASYRRHSSIGACRRAHTWCKRTLLMRRGIETMRHFLGLAERSAPRYTSYPTAPNFTSAVGTEAYVEWLTALPETGTLSLYSHVPYCTHICLYCGCHTKAVRRNAPLVRYAERLISEIEHLRGAVGRRKVICLHWGGGTPSILGEQWLWMIADRLGAAFDLSEMREHAIELDPRRLSKGLLCTLAGIGVTRASLGVQCFSPHVQDAIGRIQPFMQVERSVGWLREAGIDKINIDLMYGLPRQTTADVVRSAELAAQLSPQRLALFGYAHVPWFQAFQRLIDESLLPGPLQRLEQAQAVARTLTARGFEAIGIDHFAQADDSLAQAARRGRMHRNFQGYTDDEADALIGIGASAIGKLPQGLLQNAVDVGGYTRAIDAKRFATARGIAFSTEDRLRARIIERLMCDLAVDLDEMAAGQDLSTEIDRLTPLRDEGLVEIDRRRVMVTERGRPFLRLAAAAFDAYLPSNRTRHSIAV